ncbi:hypothetical protein GP486_008925, partial [Trichoglossum hirsutum]
MLNGFGKLRLRSVVAPQMPKTERHRLYVEMNKEQHVLYQQFLDDGYVWNEETGTMHVASTSMERVLFFRKLLVTPKLIDPSYGVGAAIEGLGDEFEELEGDARHIVVFTPFIDAIPVISEYLRGRGAKAVFTLQGGVEPDDLRFRIQEWKKLR